jgi:hypothetical protein
MELSELLKKVSGKQRKLLTAIALGANEEKALVVADASARELEYWKDSNETFRELYHEVCGFNRVAEAIQVYLGKNLQDYLDMLDDLGRSAQSEKVRLETLKYLVMLLGGEKTQQKEMTVLEKYVLDGKDREVKMRVTG